MQIPALPEETETSLGFLLLRNTFACALSPFSVPAPASTGTLVFSLPFYRSSLCLFFFFAGGGEGREVMYN